MPMARCVEIIRGKEPDGEEKNEYYEGKTVMSAKRTHHLGHRAGYNIPPSGCPYKSCFHLKEDR